MTDQAGAAQATTPEQGQQSAAPAQQQAPVQSQQSAPPWYGEVDDQTLGYLQQKGWDKPDAPRAVFDSYRNAEKLIGQIKGSPDRILVMPKDWENAEEVNEFYAKLGRPESPDKYSIQSEHPVFKPIAEAAHKAGIPDNALKSIIDTYDQTVIALAEQRFEQRSKESETQLAQVKQEWGAAYDAKVAAGKAAARAFPALKDNMNKIEAAVGTKAFMELMATIGEKLGEDQAVGLGNSPAGFGMTPQMAMNEINELKMDNQFMDAYLNGDHPGHQAAVTKFQRLMQQAYPQ